MRCGLAGFVLLVTACVRPIDLVATLRADGDDASNDAGPDVIGRAETAAPPPHVACAADARIVVLTTESAFFSFDPASETVGKLGTLDCPEAKGANPVALALGDDGAMFVLLDLGVLLHLAKGPSGACDFAPKAPAPITLANGAGLALARSKSPLLYLGADVGLYESDGSALPWMVLATLAKPDHFRALFGTGDGRLFGVIAPRVKDAYRVSSIDAVKGTVGGTVLVPAAAGVDADGPAGFALWGDVLFVFTEKTLAQYNFATGIQTAPLNLPELVTPIVAAASPPCASTL